MKKKFDRIWFFDIGVVLFILTLFLFMWVGFIDGLKNDRIKREQKKLELKKLEQELKIREDKWRECLSQGIVTEISKDSPVETGQKEKP